MFVVDHVSHDNYFMRTEDYVVAPHPPSALKLISSDPIFDSSSFEVEAIMDHRYTEHGTEYLVRWKRYTKEYDTWEPTSEFDDEATISSYWKKRNGSDIQPASI